MFCMIIYHMEFNFIKCVQIYTIFTLKTFNSFILKKVKIKVLGFFFYKKCLYFMLWNVYFIKDKGQIELLMKCCVTVFCLFENTTITLSKKNYSRCTVLRTNRLHYVLYILVRRLDTVGLDSKFWIIAPVECHTWVWAWISGSRPEKEASSHYLASACRKSAGAPSGDFCIGK